jgi:hypothetical protein
MLGDAPPPGKCCRVADTAQFSAWFWAPPGTTLPQPVARFQARLWGHESNRSRSCSSRGWEGASRQGRGEAVTIEAKAGDLVLRFRVPKQDPIAVLCD